MPPPLLSADHLERVCALVGARQARPTARIQSLWSGYGQVLRVALTDGPAPTVVVKHVQPPPGAHPRKLRSYEVERAWYAHWAAHCDETCRVPRAHGFWTEGSESLFVLEDLDASGFPLRMRMPSAAHIGLCLDWLAAFHGRFLGADPEGLWPVGTYWHLATRPNELAAMSDPALQARAPELDAALSGARFQTLVHGDAKLANFCFAADGAAVAAVDFQYVGGGCGMKDVAYFLEGCLGTREHARDGARWLDRYFGTLRQALPDGVDGEALEAEWRGLYETARLDFDRFLDGWR